GHRERMERWRIVRPQEELAFVNTVGYRGAIVANCERDSAARRYRACNRGRRYAHVGPLDRFDGVVEMSRVGYVVVGLDPHAVVARLGRLDPHVLVAR